jgi:hypothetical protein
MAHVAITLRKVLCPQSCLCQNSEVKESRMGIAMFSIQGVLAPLQGLMAWFVQAAPGAPATSPVTSHARVAGTAPRACGARVQPSTSCRERPRRPLRVLRVVESSRAPASAGRMVISGRMADVCAELDRLAALEAAAR